MRWIQPLFTASETLFDRVLCVTGAVAFSQAPEFMQQYLQRLGGNLDEARRQLRQFEDVAQKAGMTLDQLVAQTTTNSNAITSGLGRVVAATETRVSLLSSAEVAIRDASTFSRPFEFMRHFDPEIARNTWAIFKPAVPTTFEGATYAAIGMIAFLSLYHGLVKYPVRRIGSAAKRPKPPASVATPREIKRFTI